MCIRDRYQRRVHGDNIQRELSANKEKNPIHRKEQLKMQNGQVIYPPQNLASNPNSQTYYNMGGPLPIQPNPQTGSQFQNQLYAPQFNQPQGYPAQVSSPSRENNNDYSVQVCLAWVLLSFHIILAIIGGFILQAFIRDSEMIRVAWFCVAAGSITICFGCYSLNTGIVVGRIDTLRRAPGSFLLGGIANTFSFMLCLLGSLNQTYKDIPVPIFFAQVFLVFVYVYYITFSRSVIKKKSKVLLSPMLCKSKHVHAYILLQYAICHENLIPLQLSWAYIAFTVKHHLD
eukprot:TRINITY_DN13876_c0_g3_i1.p1 TRINITY_DN13876_c0_g3~~TRINITY_DN13876_c0_g3_i1.p1  ORF type:complete len:307 (+),score=50.11 TRINITY_DN13876_c0_g3_i1:61-921(+)